MALMSGVMLLAARAPASAQGACAAEAANQRGGWVQREDAGGNGSPVTARNRAAARAVLDRIGALVKAAYPDPVGSQGRMRRNWGLESFAGGDAATYELTASFMGYGCDRRTNPQGVVTPHTETATWLYVQVNSFWPGPSNLETRQFFLSPQDEQGLLTLPPARVLRTPAPTDAGRKRIDASVPAGTDGWPTFVHEGAYDSYEASYNTREVAFVIFITPDGQLPYDAVTIGEFLDINEARLRRYIQANREFGVEAEERLLARIPALRTKYAGALAQPAYVGSATWNESDLRRDEPFVAPEQGYRLVRRSNRYTTGSNVHAPRFITVFWRWQPEVGYSVRAHEAIRDRLDFAALAALLEK